MILYNIFSVTPSPRTGFVVYYLFYFSLSLTLISPPAAKTHTHIYVLYSIIYVRTSGRSRARRRSVWKLDFIGRSDRGKLTRPHVNTRINIQYRILCTLLQYVAGRTARIRTYIYPSGTPADKPRHATAVWQYKIRPGSVFSWPENVYQDRRHRRRPRACGIRSETIYSAVVPTRDPLASTTRARTLYTAYNMCARASMPPPPPPPVVPHF